ncbi:MAG TPA: hypothetical protein VMT42_05915 [candidate division Zixibacteria bacterium]|nr:hypothetical protein [candidate division Zixibacteria bacterium]
MNNSILRYRGGLRIEVSSISIYLLRSVRNVRRRHEDRYLNVEEVRILEITINIKQAIALVWTLIAIALSLIVVLEMGLPQSILGTSYVPGVPWWLLIAAFFGVFLVITLPVYLLIALWGITSRNENE